LGYSAGNEKPFRVVIKPDTVHCLRVNALENGDALIPRQYHRIGPSGMEAFCLTVEQDGDSPDLIIPAVEVLRFYYAISTSLAKACI
jgi:hypothetical protein